MLKASLHIFTLIAALALAVGVAHADIDVTITSIDPSDGVLNEGDTATITFNIESDDETGSYDVVIGGDGTPDSGDAISDSDGSGTFSGNTSGSAKISSTSDLDGDGDYTVYVIAVDDSDDTNYASASITITLDSPPGSVTGVRAGAGDGRIFLEWDEHEDNDIDRYSVYYDTQSGGSADDYLGSDSDLGTSPIDAGLATELTLSGLENNVTYYMRVSATDEQGTESTLSVEVHATPTDAKGAAELADDTEPGCFVATAAYGDIDHPMLVVFRGFRDDILMHSEAGRAFVQAYYKYSPPFARVIADHPMLRFAARSVLTPMAESIAYARTHTRSSLAVFGLLIGSALMAAPIGVRRIKKGRA
ncbi:fibronectin type III domain-containing protein [bacterium]|nr:fibronectin type III domain-containing protein [bacterium]